MQKFVIPLLILLSFSVASAKINVPMECISGKVIVKVIPSYGEYMTEVRVFHDDEILATMDFMVDLLTLGGVKVWEYKHIGASRNDVFTITQYPGERIGVATISIALKGAHQSFTDLEVPCVVGE